MIDDDGAATATEDDDGLVIVVDGADGVGLFTIALNTDVPPPPPAAVSLVVLPRFLFANSYMSPNMPANVFLKFFIVSSASSATEVCDVGPGRADCPAPAVGRDDDETVDDCDTCESRRPTDDKPGAFSTDAISGGSEETLLRLPWRPIDPGPGVVRSGIGGGPLVETGRGADGIGGAISSVGLPPRDEIDDLETALAIVGRQTFCKVENCNCWAIQNIIDVLTCIRETTKSDICLRSSSCVSPINGRVLSEAPKICSRPSFPTAIDRPQTSMPPNISDTCKVC